MQKYDINKYSVETILSWVKNKEVVIPEIQRPFVWKAKQVRDLIDSLYKGYPTGYYVYTFEDDDLVGTVGESWVPCYQILIEAVGVVNGRTQYEQIKVKQGRATLHRPKGYSFLSINPLNWEEVKNNT